MIGQSLKSPITKFQTPNNWNLFGYRDLMFGYLSWHFKF